MSKIKEKELEVQIMQVTAGRMNLELDLLKREADIERIKQNITVSDEKINELKQKLGEIKNG